MPEVTEKIQVTEAAVTTLAEMLGKKGESAVRLVFEGFG